ncbi:sulfatase-like hydrolase/transferase [Gayadomonas joobiniege]|uniref:sulfatase-like hydrolase/transferase n=1 Tax=Gayadomonas joobiniege TaxID=1234606 RepID=UPI000A4F7A4A|nr:sulfatase-like hydrolase/transferase [Gayadomonas joobiniege]
MMKKLLSLMLGAAVSLSGAASAAEQSQPNVVLILIDDLSHYGMTTYGANRIRSVKGEFEDITFSTPNIDKLAETGLRMENAFTHPLCENTRIALMSGKQNDRNYLKPKSQHHSDITFGDVFQRAGYATGMYGKWKQTRGTSNIPGKQYISEFGWDDYVAFDVVTEGQRFINPNLVINGEIANYQGRTDLDPETGRRWYGPDIYNRAALNFIEQNKDKPFFLYYPMALVHDDHKPTPDTKPNSIFDNYDEATHNRNGHKGDEPKYLGDMIEYTDKLIGKVVNKLNQLNLREETLIIVMGDNGTKEIFHHVLPDGSVYPSRKGGNADPGIHVGMVVNQPGTVPAGDGQVRSYDGLTYLTDVFPTIAEAAGIKIPSETRLDGKSFWAQATGQSREEHRDHIYSWYMGNGLYHEVKDPRKISFAFDKNFKYYGPSVYFPQGRFFDLKNDPYEKAGDRYVELRFSVRRYSGLNMQNLTPEQYEAMLRLKKVVESRQIKPVESVEIIADISELKVGETFDLDAEVTPINATRDGVIWHSSNPQIATVNKFGEVTAHQAGEVTISLYSWSDARPLADNKSPEFLTDGIQDSITLEVVR